MSVCWTVGVRPPARSTGTVLHRHSAWGAGSTAPSADKETEAQERKMTCVCNKQVAAQAPASRWSSSQTSMPTHTLLALLGLSPEYWQTWNECMQSQAPQPTFS